MDPNTRPVSESSKKHNSGDGHLQLTYQPAFAICKSRFAVVLFLSVEALFFAVLIGTSLVWHLGSSEGSWPAPEEVQLVIWLGALQTIVLACSCVTIFFSVLEAKQAGASGSRKWLIATFLLGAVFLGLGLSEYRVKVRQGIYPGTSNSLLAERADLDYLTRTKLNLDAQIRNLEKAVTVARGQAGGTVEPENEQNLKRLKLIRDGLVQWTQRKVGRSRDPKSRAQAIDCLAYQVGTPGPDLEIEKYIASEQNKIKENLVELQKQQADLNQRVALLQQELTQLSGRDLVGKSPDVDRQALQAIMIEKTEESILAANESSLLADEISMIRKRIAATDTFGDLEVGVNRQFQLNLPMVIPGGERWARAFFLMTGIHALHVVGGLCVVLHLLIVQSDSAYVGWLENLSLYWHFMSIIWVFLFFLFYLF